MKIAGFVAALALLLGSGTLTGGTLPTVEAAPKDSNQNFNDNSDNNSDNKSPCPPAMANHSGDGRAKLNVKAVMTDNRMKGGSSFDAGDVKRLVIFTKWTPHVWSSHTQRVKLFTPGGSLYQQFTAMIGGEEKDVQTPVLVAGTWITEFSLYGTWCAQVFLDDEEVPSGEDTFVLSKPAPKNR